MERITPSLLWDDMYTFTMSQAYFIRMPNAKVRMSYVDREPTRPYVKDIVEKLRDQVAMLSDLSLQNHEYDYLGGIRFMHRHYLDWLKSYRFDPNEINIE